MKYRGGRWAIVGMVCHGLERYLKKLVQRGQGWEAACLALLVVGKHTVTKARWVFVIGKSEAIEISLLDDHPPIRVFLAATKVLHEVRFCHQCRCRVDSHVIVEAWQNDLVAFRTGASGGKDPLLLDVLLVFLTISHYGDFLWSNASPCWSID